MNSFWDKTWENVNGNRVIKYIEGFDMEEDTIIKDLKTKRAYTVCDAGCGCGIYSLKLAANGFKVSGFDISSHAVKIAQELLEKASIEAELKTASVLSTGYQDNWFDGVVARDVIDHMCKTQGIAAVRELYRILKPGGILLITLDSVDEEYETEPHTLNEDGDFVFTDGKWQGMVFHPYGEQEIRWLVPEGGIWEMASQDGEILIKVIKTQ